MVRISLSVTARATHESPKFGLVESAPGLGFAFKLLELGEDLALGFGGGDCERILAFLEPDLANMGQVLAFGALQLPNHS